MKSRSFPQSFHSLYQKVHVISKWLQKERLLGKLRVWNLLEALCHNFLIYAMRLRIGRTLFKKIIVSLFQNVGYWRKITKPLFSRGIYYKSSNFDYIKKYMIWSLIPMPIPTWQNKNLNFVWFWAKKIANFSDFLPQNCFAQNRPKWKLYFTK